MCERRDTRHATQRRSSLKARGRQGILGCGRSTVALLPTLLPRSARSPPSRLRLVARKPAAQTQRAVVGQRKPAAQRMRAVEGAGVQRILGIGRYRESLRRTHDLASADRAREVVRGRFAPALCAMDPRVPQSRRVVGGPVRPRAQAPSRSKGAHVCRFLPFTPSRKSTWLSCTLWEPNPLEISQHTRAHRRASRIARHRASARSHQRDDFPPHRAIAHSRNRAHIA